VFQLAVISLVGNHLGGLDLQHPECPSEEPPGGVGVVADRDEHVDDLSVPVTITGFDNHTINGSRANSVSCAHTRRVPPGQP
jgi:hypothetical protein